MGVLSDVSKLSNEELINVIIEMDFGTLEKFKLLDKRVYKVYKDNEDYIYKKKIEREFAPCIKSNKDLYYMCRKDVRMSEICQKKGLNSKPIFLIFRHKRFEKIDMSNYGDFEPDMEVCLYVEGYDADVALALLYKWYSNKKVYDYLGAYKRLEDVPNVYLVDDGYDLSSYNKFVNEMKEYERRDIEDGVIF
jgi:hypothetical protein